MIKTTLKGISLCLLAALFASGQAFAHTGVRDVAVEGTPSYNAFTIGHGCGGDSGDPFPVLGQSALFPNGATAIWKKADGTLIQQGGNGNGTISTPDLQLAVGGYAGFSSPFTTTQEIVDGFGTVQALFYKDGAMEPKLSAITPFKISAPTIANHCVKSLKIRMGVINYCDVDKNENSDIAGPYLQPKDAFGRKIPMLADLAGTGGVQINVKGAPFYVTLPAGNGDNNRADWWFTAPYGGSNLYRDGDLLQPDYWTTMTVNNTDAKAAGCPTGLVDVTVEPAGVAFDAYLTGPNTLPFTKGNNKL
ncbi:MAG: hypothetical protein PHO08_00345 [Methylococcales bacterium]|nr:hypothetical protein [Methylococcales bacterium]MDD5630562.1 hypothetical protein [Methylococcales bacterium]